MFYLGNIKYLKYLKKTYIQIFSSVYNDNLIIYKIYINCVEKIGNN